MRADGGRIRLVRLDAPSGLRCRGGYWVSYLDSPRLHFTGCFQADVSTINNDVSGTNGKNWSL